MRRIYLDNNATTEVDPTVIQAVVAELESGKGNPSSLHIEGQRSRQRLNQYRQVVARFLKVHPSEILFTSGGTEGAYLLLHGLLQQKYQGHLITSVAEHACIFKNFKYFEKMGCDVSFLPVDEWGAVTPQQLEKALRPDTRLICLMAVNNETGVKTDVEGIAKIAEKHGIPFIVDGVAQLGKEEIVLPKGVSGMFFSGHKCHAPKGVGFVFCRQSLRFESPFLGGHQEYNRRAGTENLPGIAGLAAAIQLLENHQSSFIEHMRTLRDLFETGLQHRMIQVNGEGPRIANTSNLSFLNVDGESLLLALDQEGVAVSHGSACSSGALEPSRILLNMGIPLARARSALRFSVSRYTTQEDIEECLSILDRLLKRLFMQK